MNSPFRSPYMTPQLGDDWRLQEWQKALGQTSAFPVQTPANSRWDDGTKALKRSTGFDANRELTGFARDIGGDWAGDMTDTFLNGGRKAAAMKLGGQALGALGLGSAASGAAGAGAAGAAGAGGLGGAMSALSAAL